MTNATVEKEPKQKSRGLTLTRQSAAPRKADGLIIGDIPRVHLLPPEMIARKAARRTRRRLGLGLVASVVLVAAGVGLATVSLLSSQSALTTAQNASADLASQQAKYGAVTKLQLDAAAIKTAQTTATKTEILWQPYIAEIQKTLTKGMEINALNGSIDDPNTASSSTNTPLEGPRIATLKVTVLTPQASISDWLVSLQGLTGFVDATPGSVTLVQGQYKVDVLLHINDKALANRFATATK